MADVIVSGHLCLDLIPRMENVALGALGVPGRLSEVGALDFATGGAVSNTGLALHRLGVNVRLMATVGDDLIGQVITRILEDRDPALTQLITIAPGQPGSYSVVLSPQRVDRIFLHCTGTNSAFGVANIDFSLLAGAKIFHLGYPPLLPRLMNDDGAELEAIYRRAQAAGVVTSLDMTLPDPNGPSGQANWIEILRRTLPYTDIFLPSIEEIMFMLRRTEYMAWRDNLRPHLTADYLRALADDLMSMGVAIAGFKLGALGLYFKTADAERLRRLRPLNLPIEAWANRELYTPAYEVSVIGTTGAGDSAYAGFLAALLRGMNPDEAAMWACAVGACNVEAADALSGVRPWEATAERLRAGWPVRQDRPSGF
ncbi:MAG: carbohydrate kinase family protein [Chloroflexi bacterium]|nr:carbohydrate kinase family protein [Chloroflexota bacterium]